MFVNKRFSIASPIGAAVTLIVVLATGAAFASTGVGSLVSEGDDGAVTARGSQQDLGALSATPPVRVAPDEGSEVNTLGARAGGDSGGDAPSGAVASSGSGSGAAKLPFTGFLAIPVLLLGVGLLMGGLFTRWGSRETTASA